MASWGIDSRLATARDCQGTVPGPAASWALACGSAREQDGPTQVRLQKGQGLVRRITPLYDCNLFGKDMMCRTERCGGPLVALMWEGSLISLE